MYNQSTVVTQSPRTNFTFYLGFVSVCLNKHLRQSKVEIPAFDHVLASSSELHGKPRRRLQRCISALTLACLEKWGRLKWRWQKRLLLKPWSCKDFESGGVLWLSRITPMFLAVPMTAGIEQIKCFFQAPDLKLQSPWKAHKARAECFRSPPCRPVPLSRLIYVCTIMPLCSQP